MAAATEWRAHWPKVVSAMAGMSFYAMLTYQFGLFIQPIEQAFGWPRASISLGLTIYTMSAVLLGPVVGAVIDAVGSRRIGLIGILATALAFAALGLANGSLARWYLLWSAIAIGALGVKTTVWSAGISGLFTVGRGLALALVLCGSAIAQSLSPLVADALIASHGWRAAYAWIGFGWGGVAFVLVALFFYDAHDQRRRAAPVPGGVAPLGGLTGRQALRSHQIARIAFANVILSCVGAGVQVHMVPLLSGYGIDRAAAAGMTATAGVAGIAGKLLTGWALDRVRGNLLPFTSFGLAALGYLLLLDVAHARWGLVLGIMVLGYTSGAGLQVTTYLVGRYGGLRSFGRIYGTIGSTMMLGTSVGPWLAGRVFDTTGSYASLLAAGIPVALVSALALVGLGPYPSFAEADAPPLSGGR